MKTLVVGGVGLDDIETPRGEANDLVGGSAWYFAHAASFFAPVLMVGVIGSDFPREEVEMLRRRGVDMEGLHEVPGPSFRWAGRYHENLNVRDTLRLDLNVFEHFTPVLPLAYRNVELAFLANIHPSLQISVLDQLQSPRLVVCDTLPHWIHQALPELLTLLRRVDVLTINEDEARLLAQEHSVVRAARRILELGPRMVLVKRGEYGVLAFSRSGVFAVPAYPLEDVIDPTGAGDSFAGGLMGDLALSGDVSDSALRRAIVRGNVVASFVVEDFGLRRLISLSNGDIQTRLGEYIALTRFSKIG